MKEGSKENKYQKYIELIQALLKCAEGEEAQILTANEHLIDEGLLEAIEVVAANFDEQQEDGGNWLRNLGQYLTQYIESTQPTEADYDFLLEVLRIIDNSGEKEQFFELLRQNPDKITLRLATALQNWADNTLANIEAEQQPALGYLIFAFSAYLQQFPLGNRANNIEIAITGYQIILNIYTQSDFPVDWATTQNNLGLAYNERIRGDRVENIEQAIAYYQNALIIYTQQDFPVNWASAQNNFGNTYSERIKGDRAENIENAISAYNNALTIRTQTDFPTDWAITQNNLGLAYSNRIKGDKAQNIEDAINAYQQALIIYTSQDFPVQWAMTQNNLGNVYSDRIKGDKAENIEIAILAYQQALTVRTRQDFPVDWAMTQNNLATAYSNRIRGDRDENLETAIAGYKNALSIYTQAEFPLKWASTQNNLATVYSNQIRGDRDENLETAIAYYHNALQEWRQDTYPYEWAMIQNNLGNSYSDRNKGDKNENLETAIAYYHNALQEWRQDTYPYEWASTHNNLGNTYSNRIKGYKTENTKRAIKYYQNALIIRTPQNSPIECFLTAKNLGKLYFAQNNWQLAIESYSLAIEAVEQTRAGSRDDTRRQEIIAESIDTYQNIVQAYINNGQFTKAIEYIERERSNYLLDLITTQNLYSDKEESLEVQAYLKQYQYLQRQIDVERFENYSSEGLIDFADFNQKISELEKNKQQIWKKIRSVTHQNLLIDPIDFFTIKKLINNSKTAILYFYTTVEATYVFIIRLNKLDWYSLPDQGHENLQDWILEKWLLPYTQEPENRLKNISIFSEELSYKLKIDSLVKNYLSEIEELIVVPHLYLHLISFGGLPISPNADLSLSRRKYLLDYFRIRYVPSCQILKILKLGQERLFKNTNINLGIVGNPTDNLFGSEIECDAIAKMYYVSNCNYLRNKQDATVNNFRKLLKRVQIIHFSGHGISRLDNPLESQLFLGDGSITLGEILTCKLPNLRQVFLSSCESGFSNITITDDALNIGTGFLLAGANNVCSTLWAVDDLATAIFSIFYYQYLKEHFDSPTALQQAQQRLRHLSGEEFDRNYYIDFHTYLTIQFEQAKTNRKQVTAQLKQLPQSTPESSQLELEAQKSYWNQAEKKIYASIKRLKQVIKEPQPFVDPYYWAGFICQGLN